MIDEALLKNEERAVFALRALYKKHGYQPFKMSKFEEYELYLRNRDFLVSDRIISFNDTDGKLMALKPDVTLSIIKNGEDSPGRVQRVYYNENVYRAPGGARRFKEIMQTGLECVGDIDGYDIFEVVSLAARSLALISEQFVLDVSHLGLLAALLGETGADAELRGEIARCVAAKNAHGIEAACKRGGVAPAQTEKLCAFAGIYGGMDGVIARLEPLCAGADAAAALSELRALRALLRGSGLEDRIHFDFSVVNDMAYYNGIVFRGFLNGVCEGVLAGGQYDKLMRKMGRSSRAIGFALYLDLLEGLSGAQREYDVDALLLYGADTGAKTVADAAEKLIRGGLSVSAQREIPDTLRYRRLVDLRGGGRRC